MRETNRAPANWYGHASPVAFPVDKVIPRWVVTGLRRLDVSLASWPITRTGSHTCGHAASREIPGAHVAPQSRIRLFGALSAITQKVCQGWFLLRSAAYPINEPYTVVLRVEPGLAK